MMNIPLRSIFGSVFFFVVFYARIMAMIDGYIALSLLNVLVTAQSGIVFILLVYRRRARTDTDGRLRILAWESAFLPLVMNLEESSLLAGLAPVPGLILTLWALAALGGSFSISPADRGLVEGGPYRFIRHPMYGGELLSLIPAVAVSSFSWLNCFLLALFVASIIVRILAEEKIVSGYAQYAEKTRWRLIPGVW